MPYQELDLNLTEEQRSMRDMVRKFGSEVMRPVGIELDDLHDPADVIAEDSKLWDVFRRFRELDLHKRAFPKALGGMAEDMDPMSGILIAEEMGYADEKEEDLSPNEFWLNYIVRPSTPLGREQTPEDMGRAAVFLVSEDAKNITGQVLHVDGGIVAR